MNSLFASHQGVLPKKQDDVVLAVPPENFQNGRQLGPMQA